MSDCILVVERGGSQTADLVTSEFTNGAIKALQRIYRQKPAEIEALCCKQELTGSKFHEATEVEISLTSISLATSLDKHNVSFVLFDDENIIEKYSTKLESLLNSSAKVVCISTTYLTDIRSLRKIIDFFYQRKKDIPIIVGGQVLDLWGDAVFSKIDHVFCYCYGDMDEAFGKLIYSLINGQNIDGMLTHVTKSGKSFYTIRQYIADLDTIYLPDWELLNTADINDNFYKYHSLPKRVPLEERRGCPNKCAFCSYRTLNKHRQKSPERIVQELISLKNLGFRKVHFIGSEFLTPISNCRKILKLIIENKLRLDILCYARIDILSKHLDLIPMMADAGITTVYFGVESGDQSILKNMNKNYNLEKIPWIIEKLKKNNINVWASFIFGFPGETMKTIQNTTNFIINADFSTIEFHALQVIPNTPLYNNKDLYQLQLIGNFWSHPTMSLLDLPPIIKKVYKDIFLRCNSSISNINDGIAKYFILEDTMPDIYKRFETFLKQLIYIEFSDEKNDKDDEVLKVWEKMKQHIKYFPKQLLELQR